MAKITFSEYLRKWGFKSIQLTTLFGNVEFAPIEDDQTCAWDMYVELITRITTQTIAPDSGDEKTALESVHSLFKSTRTILKEKGRNAPNFTRIAIIILNQIIRPFTAKWHKNSLSGYLDLETGREEFREDLELLQIDLKNYTRMLADMAKVEDLTDIIEKNDADLSEVAN